MEINIRAKNIELTNDLRQYAESKVGKLSRFFDQIREAEIELISAKNPSINDGQIVEITLFTKGHVVRGKEASTNIFASIDLVLEKLERQLKKNKDKMYRSSKRNQGKRVIVEPVPLEDESNIVRIKQIEMKPMTPEEATLQLDLLDHDFFVFTNADSEDINVIYRRRDKGYGLIQPI